MPPSNSRKPHRSSGPPISRVPRMGNGQSPGARDSSRIPSAHTTRTIHHRVHRGHRGSQSPPRAWRLRVKTLPDAPAAVPEGQPASRTSVFFAAPRETPAIHSSGSQNPTKLLPEILRGSPAVVPPPVRGSRHVRDRVPPDPHRHDPPRLLCPLRQGIAGSWLGSRASTWMSRYSHPARTTDFFGGCPSPPSRCFIIEVVSHSPFRPCWSTNPAPQNHLDDHTDDVGHTASLALVSSVAIPNP